jgi:GNAT superfamily N-acetyltransferase
MGISVRRAVFGEAATLTALAQRSKAHWGYPTEWLNSWRSQLTIDGSYILRHEVLVAELGGRIAGMCSLERSERGWALEHVWVDPEHMGHGVGKALVEQALAIAASVNSGPVRIEADPNAAGFYRRLGAREVGKVSAAMPGAPDRVLLLFEFQVGSP